MNVFTSPRTTALALSSALLVLQLVAFGSSANHAVTADECTEAAAPSAITVPPAAPRAPGLMPGASETRPVSI